MKTIARVAILVIAACLTLSLLATACGFAGTWGILRMLGRDVVLSSSRVKFWPDSWPSVALYAWAAPFHLGAAIGILFGLLPLSLAILERIYLALAPRARASDSIE